LGQRTAAAPDRSRQWKKALKDLGATVIRCTIFEGTKHGQPASQAWAQEGLLDWLLA
jgi:hypothetical protein